MYHWAFTIVRLILTKIGWFLLSDVLKQQKLKLNFDLFWKYFFFTCEDISIHTSITTVILILTKLRWFIFSGYRQTVFRNPHNYGNIIFVFVGNLVTTFTSSKCISSDLFQSKLFVQSLTQKSRLKIRSWLSIAICISGWRGCTNILSGDWSTNLWPEINEDN